jgi:PPIC-type PPIASE domain
VQKTKVTNLTAVTSLAALAAACSLAVGCGSTSNKAASSRDEAPTPTATATNASRTTAKQPAANSREAIAKIGKTTITRGLLQHWATIGMYGKPGTPEPPDFTDCVNYLGLSASETTTNEQLKLTCKEKYEQSLHKALSLLIHVPWLIDEAAKAGIRVDQAKLARETAPSGPHGEEIQGIRTTKGESLSDFRLTLTLVQLAARLDHELETRVPVTRARIADFYRLNERSFRVPEQRDLYVVRLASLSEANKAKRELEHGASFATIVSHTSLVQPNGAQNGLLHGLKPENWPEKPLPEDIFHAPLKTIEGPVQISFGYYLFEVVGKTPGRASTLTEAKPEVVRRLHQTLRERIFSRFAATFTKKWAARTACLPSDLVKYCREARSSPTSPLEVPNLLF